MKKYTPVLLLSDLHFGENIDGPKPYNIAIAEERLLSVPVKLQEDFGASARTIEEVIVAQGGDLVDGEGIFEGQYADLVEGAADQCNKVTDVLWKMILRLRPVFPAATIRVINAPGNHGRINKRGFKNSNWDQQVAVQIANLAHLRDDPRIFVELSRGSFTKFGVQRSTGLLTHKGVKHMGTPAMQAKALRWMMHHRCDFLMHGHWHRAHFTPVDDKWVICNGSLPGVNDYGESLGLFDPARQVYFLVEENRRLTNFNVLEW